MYSLFPPLALSSVLSLLSPSSHVKQYLFSIIHLPFLILFCVFPILIYLFFSSSTTLQSFLFIWISWPGSGFSWDDSELLDCGAPQQLFSTFISGCMIGDPYQLGWIFIIHHWQIPVVVDAVMLVVVELHVCTFSDFLQHVVWFFHSIFQLKKDKKIGCSCEQLWSRQKQNQIRQTEEQCGGKRCKKCNLHPSNYSSTESGNTKEVYLCFIDNTEA